MTQVKASGADGIYIGGISCFNGGQVIKDKVSVVGDNEAVKLLVSDGFVLDSLFDEAGADNLAGTYGSAPVLNPEDLTGAGKTFLDAYQAKYGDAGGLHGLRRRGRAGARRRDRPLRRHARGRRREAVRDEHHRRHRRPDVVQRER